MRFRFLLPVVLVLCLCSAADAGIFCGVFHPFAGVAARRAARRSSRTTTVVTGCMTPAQAPTQAPPSKGDYPTAQPPAYTAP